MDRDIYAVSLSRLVCLATLGLLSVSGLAVAHAIPPPVANAAVWKPAPGLRWQVQYESLPLDLNVEADVYMLDLFDTAAALVATLKKRGRRAVCYLNAGAWEKWRPDAKRFPAGVLGKDYSGWPGERWLDIRRIDVLRPLMAARLDLCREKGFDGVIFDNVDSHVNPTGFALAPADQLRYSVWLANAARARGLAPGMNNDAEQAAALQPYFDWAQAESCFAQSWCEKLRPFTDNGKAVVAIEYSGRNFDRNCARAATLGITLIVKQRALDAFRRECPR